MNTIVLNSNIIGRASGTIGAEIEEAMKRKISNGTTIEKLVMVKSQGKALTNLGIAMIAAFELIYLIMGGSI